MAQLKPGQTDFSPLHLTLNHIHEAVYLVDEKGCLQYINDEACQFMGYDRIELLGMTIPDFDPDFLPQGWPARWHELREKGSLLFETRHRTKSGQVFPVEVHANYFEFNGIHYNLALVRNISERKNTEQALLQSEERYRRFVETSYEGILIQENGIILDANSQFAHLFGYESPDELIGQKGLELLLTPASQEAIRTGISNTGSLGSIEVTGKRRDGSIFIGETQSQPYPYKGKAARVVAMRDITEQKKTETRLKEQSIRARVLSDLLQAIIETTHDFIKAADLSVKRCAELIGDGASLFWYSPDNPNLDLISVYNEDPKLVSFFRNYMQDHPIGADEGAYGQVIHSNQSVIVPVIDMEQIRANAAPERLEYYEKLPLYSMILAPLRLEGHCIGIIGLGRHDPQHARYNEDDLVFLQEIADHISIALVNAYLFHKLEDELSERFLAENEVRRLNLELEQRVAHRTAQLEAANRELEAFSYSVSHDLRAPLRAINSFSLILQEDYVQQLDSQGAEYLERIIHASKTMFEKIDALLKLARIIRAEIHPTLVDISQMAETEIELLQAAEPGRKTTIMVTPGLHAWADRALIQVVIDNLMNNAWKYTSKKAVTYIEFGMLEIKGTKTYYLKDNGAGFNMAYIGKLFGTFERLHGENEYPGHGIGLATVMRVIQRHGGQVWAKAEPEKGATFYVRPAWALSSG